MQTLETEIHRLLKALPPHNATHPFASTSESTQQVLQEMIKATARITHSLNVYLSLDMSNTKLVSLLRQFSSISQALHNSEQHVRQTIDSLRERSSTSYGEDIPLDRSELLDWTISRLESWGQSVGMELFQDKGPDGSITLVLGGKVLVIDIVFSVDNTQSLDATRRRLNVASVRTSYAVPSEGSGVTAGSTTTDGSVSLDAFLAETFQRFLVEVQRSEEVRNATEASRSGILIKRQLAYLCQLDSIAFNNKDVGLQWFVDVDILALKLEDIAKKEAEVVASSLSLKHAPLDVFLLRSHALPLPYLTSPSLSLLVYVSPLIYLSLKRSFSSPVTEDVNLPALDVDFASLRSYLADYPTGATIANLRLSSKPTADVGALIMAPNFDSRPSFPLVSSASDMDHVFPHVEQGVTSTWLLDFTAAGTKAGIVISQSRMRDIDLILNPLGGMEPIDTVRMMSFGTGSWVDLLLNTSTHVSPERYTALYRSPNSIHPPLQLRLTPPEEPGFKIEQLKVRSMKEVWAIMEVVREQCWLNEILNGCHWTPEGLTMDADVLPAEDGEATQEELDAILNGRFTPRKIPVNVYLPTSRTQSPPGRSKPTILLTSPERPPISGLVEISVTFDESRPRGIAVEVHGAMGADLTMDVLEEVVRRGGLMSLPGRVWSAANNATSRF